MQEKERDLRSFPEIWVTLTKEEKEDVTRQLITDGYTLSRQTVHNWASGKWQPRTLAAKKGVAVSVSKAIGLRVFGQTLFPSR